MSPSVDVMKNSIKQQQQQQQQQQQKQHKKTTHAVVNVDVWRREQQLGDFVAAKVRRVVQRLFLEVVERIHVGAVLEQEDRDVVVPSNGRVVQGRLAVFVGQMNVGLGCRQEDMFYF
jgi:hypothetical protein